MPVVVTNAEVGCAGVWLEPPEDPTEPTAYIRLIANGYENGRVEPSYAVELAICREPSEFRAADAPMDGYDDAVRSDIWLPPPPSPRHLPQVSMRVPGKQNGEVSKSVLLACAELLGKMGITWTPTLEHKSPDSTAVTVRAPRESLILTLGNGWITEVPAVHFVAASLQLARVEVLRRKERLLPLYPKI